MFIAKLKTATVLLCGIAALGLGTGGLLYQTRAGAADSPQPGQDARAREKSLLEELEKVRKDAFIQRDRAEAERKRAEEALLALKEQLAKAQEAERRARQEAERALYADRVRQAQQGLASKPEERKALDRLAEVQAEARERFKKERQELMERMKKLEAEERDTLMKLEAQAGELRKQMPRGASPDGDKLDRILERLDRIERRLEKLERSGPSSGASK